MAIKKTIEVFLNKNASVVIANLPDKFDSHDFIQALIKKDERGYVEELYGCVNSKGGIFKYFHSQIGAYLSKNRKTLDIESKGNVQSENIKDYESPNEAWLKTS